MPPTYINNPDIKITLGSTEYTNEVGTQVVVTRLENGFDTATLHIADYKSSLYPSTVTTGTAIDLEVKDKSKTAYPTNPLFSGIVRFPIIPYDLQGEPLILKCDGAGYGFGDTSCAEEYGTQSRHPSLDTIQEILTDASYGIVPKYVEKVMASATNSGFNYDTSSVDWIAGTIPYQIYPYKPNNKVLDDLCDIVCALGDGATAGPHWIVTTDDHLHVKLISTDQVGWHKYYNSAAATTECYLYQGNDFTDYKFEKIGPEANYIIYYGAWRRPSNGDAWTESSTDWTAVSGCTIVADTDAADHRVNSAAIKITGNGAAAITALYQTGGAAWNYDFTSFREYNTPSFNFWAKRDATLNGAAVRLSDNAGANYFEYNVMAELASADTWYHFSLPIGPFYQTGGASIWTVGAGAPDWSDIDYVAFISNNVNGATLHIDGMHFGDAWVCRVAYNSTSITADKLKVKTITDNVGKDDSLVVADDSGLMAQMAYNELLRCQTTSLVGYVTTSLIGEVLPGQIFKIYAKKDVGGAYKINGTEMRVTKIVHNITVGGGFTTLYLTDDLLNSHPRMFYEDWNKVMAATRPEYQDRQTTSMKAGYIDIRVERLAKDYP